MSTLFCIERQRPATRRCTEWWPRDADWQFGGHGEAAIGELMRWAELPVAI